MSQIFSTNRFLMDKKKYITLLFFFLLVNTSYLKADENLEFQLALKLYDSLQYDDALRKFEKLSREENSKTTISYLFYSKTLLQLNKLDDAEKNLEKFLNLYPNSSYADEARITLAKAYYLQKNYLNSFNELLYVIDKSAEVFYKDYSKTTAEKIGVNYLSISQLKNIISVTTLKKAKPFVQLLKGKIYLKDKNYEDAKSAFLELLQLYPVSEERDESFALYKSSLNPGKDETVKSSNTLIGVMFPLSSNNNSAAANEILEGAKFAVSEFNKDRSDKIGLLIRDTEMKREKISEIKKDFSSIPSLKVILGPVFSTEVKEALEEFNDQKIAVVSPTATDNDLTLMYENFFQANPNFTIRGKAMAQYIYFVENKRRIAVLNALEGYSPLLASSFISEFEKLGGQIVIKETYKSGTYNLEAPVNNLSAHISEAQGIYIPLVDKTDAPAILSQFVQSKINLPIYGNQDWMYAKGFETSPVLSNQLIIDSDYFIDYNDEGFKNFSDAFYKQTKIDVNRNVLYGYDAAKYLLTVLRNFSGSSSILNTKMGSGLTSAGYHNNLSFDEKRVNRFLNIIRYNEGRFELVDQFKVKN